MVDTFTHFPYQGDGVSSIAVYFQALNAAHAGYGVLTGMAVTRSSVSAVAVASGTYANGIPPSTETYAGGSVSGVTAASSGLHRYDAIYLDTSDGVAKRVAGVENTPSNAANFLENAVPQPPDLPDENAVLLAVICVDDSGIVAGDHGSYSVAGVADMRIKIGVGNHNVSYLYDSGEAQGDIIYRGAANWDNLAAGTAGKYLKTQGAAANPTWDNLLVSSLSTPGQTTGDILTYGVAAWERKGPGSANYYLMSNGAGAALTYEKLKIGSLYHASEAQGCLATRGNTTWGVLTPGTAGYVLKSGGAGADLSWGSISSTLEGLGTCARGDLILRGSSSFGRLAKGTSGQFLKQGADEAAWASLTTYRLWDAPPTAWSIPTSGGAERGTDTGTNGFVDVLNFDASSDEYVQATLKVPPDIDTTGTVTFEVTGYAATGSSANVVWDLQHSPRTVGGNESWDAAFTSESSGAKACDADQDQLSHHTWTETVSAMGWAANDHVRIRLYRDANNGSDTMPYDFRLTHFRMKIPTVIT